MKVGLFFGSYNPIHIGHLAIANYMVEFSDLDELWMVVSPQNPFKNRKNLLNEVDRLNLVELALQNDIKIKASNIEFTLPKPSYTIDTLTYLNEKYPNKEFAIIMGSDNLIHFHKWKNTEQILKHYQLYVYPRPNTSIEKYKNNNNITIVDAPLMEISSSFIRTAIKSKKDIRYFLPKKVYHYIMEMHFYENH
ncbi:MAG: nicotinate (nicotinamide) nucleotide adenylyltransferase [Bacteroidales bacterium]|jgi:nicotinate-nucleotide adenylyltransferase|nr:nicotinate (nicotinamide) nucleotide adenylyltransferase [Bacteroidales bacterium]